MNVVLLENLGKPDKADIPLLKTCLADTSELVRTYAASALGKLGADARAAVPDLLKVLMDKGLLKGAAHITGGGITDNLPRILPKGLAAHVNTAGWKVPPIFELLKQKVPVLAYTIKTGGGPWHRYLVDLLLVSPAILILALANLLAAKRHRSRADRYLGTFSCLSYLALTAFPDGMNLRYIVMLDMPLRFLATTQLFALSRAWGHYRHVLLALAVIALCAYDLRQHDVLFVKGNLYELVTEGLIRAQGIIK